MTTFTTFGLNQAYQARTAKFPDRLSEIGKTLEWESSPYLKLSLYQ